MKGVYYLKKAFRPKRLLRRIYLILAVSAAALFLPCPAHAYSYYETETVLLGSASAFYSLELWHHSGGYWKVPDGTGGLIKVRDSAIEMAGICGYLNSTQFAKWSVALPEKVKTALKEGRRVTANASDPNLDKHITCTISGASCVDVYAKPVFHIATSATLNSYVPGISITIPLVSSNYGRNVYAIYGLLCYGEPGLGYFSNAQPGKVITPLIHPSQITNRLGWLKSGETINVHGEAVSTAGHTVGLLTLAKGGAVGLHFDFPITVYFYEEVQKLVTVSEPMNEFEGPNDDTGIMNSLPDDLDPADENRSEPVLTDDETEKQDKSPTGNPDKPVEATKTKPTAPTSDNTEKKPANSSQNYATGNQNSVPQNKPAGSQKAPTNDNKGTSNDSSVAPPAFVPDDYHIHRAF